eukprot:TRINITY_DN9199_c0_g1_i1.p1 TRINITY_DN9199_c0_g1~~TRINITY_DN9199_c0_g1_i1.p1  ORF type:complete len:472 (-),score=93.69 TRINITY_DN9199_c0_g1_i1:23-1414(-)
MLARLAILAVLLVAARAGPPPPPPQNTSTPQAIAETAYMFLRSHLVEGEKWGLHYHFYQPSLQKYSPDQWLWDSGSHMITWSHRNATNSVLDLRTMLQMQQPSGFIPEMIFWSNQTFWDLIKTGITYSNERFTDITQMPVLAFSLRAIWNATRDPALLQEFVPKLANYWRWWRTRDVSGDGLVSIVHGWESGLDASPLYDKAYSIFTPRKADSVLYWEMYPKFVELTVEYHLRYGWNVSKIIHRTSAPNCTLDCWFLVKDVGLNAVYAAGWGVLADLAAEANLTDLAVECRAGQQSAEKAIIDNCWDKDLRRFVSWYRDHSGAWQKVTVEAVQSLFPLLLESLPSDIHQSIVQTQLTNASKFWLPYPLPTVSADSVEFTPDFTVDLMWRGPTWSFPNWFVMEGLVRHGYTAEANEMLDRWVSLYKNAGGIWEQYNPLTAAPYGAVGLGMSTLIVDWLYRLGRL